MGEPEQEGFSDSFSCCVCLDLLYKPIVLSCGHISCFWCVYQSMKSWRESHCPLCRHPYYHFPTVCQMLHFLLLKMDPVAYKRRESLMFDKEKKTGFFSPQFHNASGSEIKSDRMFGSPSSSFMDHKSKTCADPLVSLNHNSYIDMELSDLSREGHDEGKIKGKSDASETLSVEESHHCEQKELISVTDVLCIACNRLLYHPVILNCGHAYCEVCIVDLSDEVIKCQLCQSPHPMGVPKVCLVLDQFLEDRFPYEYGQRRDTIQLKAKEVKHKATSTCLADTPEGKDRMPCWTDPNSKIHRGIGCDFCGMFPIVGDRYRCKDCVEKIGFDLCGDCFNTGSQLPGRFNQQHTPDHSFEHVQPSISFRLGSGVVVNRDIPIINVASQSLELVFQAPAFSDDSDEEHNTESSD